MIVKTDCETDGSFYSTNVDDGGGAGERREKESKCGSILGWMLDRGAVSSFERELGRRNVGQVPAPPPPLATSHHHQTHKTLHATPYTCTAPWWCVVTHTNKNITKRLDNITHYTM